MIVSTSNQYTIIIITSHRNKNFPHFIELPSFDHALFRQVNVAMLSSRAYLHLERLYETKILVIFVLSLSCEKHLKLTCTQVSASQYLL